MTELNGATVLLTGASGGFGQQLTTQLLRAGSELVLSDHGDRVASLVALQAGEPAIRAVIAADLSDNAGCDRLCESMLDTGCSPDILINNAGVAYFGRPDHVPDGLAESLLQVNLLSPMRLSRHFIPAMLERGHGHIVNISSVAGWIGAEGLSAYCASKFGLRGFGEALAVDLSEQNIAVSTVYPWFSRTPILDSKRYGVDDEIQLPDDLVTDPADVCAEILAGIRANRQHIFPDPMARRVQLVKRFLPWLIPVMQKRLRERVT